MDQATSVDALHQAHTVIYCYGGIDIYKDVFNAIAMLNNDHSFIKMLFTLATVIGGLWAIIVMAFGDLLKPFTSWIIPAAIMQTFLLMPGKTVWLVDVVQHKHQNVDNVPYGLAILAGNLSRLSHTMTKKLETIFSLPDDLKYHKSGGIFGANLMESMKIFTIQDADFAENMRGFVGNCVLYDVALGRKYTIEDLRKTHDIWGLVSRDASPARSFIWKDKGRPGEIMTCREGALKFNQVFPSQISRTACHAGAFLFGNHGTRSTPLPNASYGVGAGQGSEASDFSCRTPLSQQEIIKYLPLHHQAFTGASRQAGDIIKQQMMIAAIVDGQDHASVLSGNAPNFAIRKAYLHQRLTNETFGKLAANTLPMLRTCLELLCYSMFLFLIPILVLPMGYRVLTSWAQVVLWLSMWPPMYAILNLIVTSAQSMRTLSTVSNFNPEGLSLISSLGVQQISADISSQAGYLTTLVPFVCIAIVKGLSNFMHLSSSLMGSGQGAASAAAAEAASGNFSYANSSLDNMTYRSSNMLSQNFSPSLSSGDFRVQDGHKSMSIGADGHAVMSIAQSQSAISINAAEQIAHNKRTAAAQETSLSESHQKSAEKSIAQNIENLATLGKTLSSGTNIQSNLSEQQQYEMGKAMQNVNNTIDRISKTLGVSKNNAAQLMATASPPFGAFFQNTLGIGGSLQTDTKSASNDDLQKTKEIMAQTNLEDNLRLSAQGIKQLSKNDSHDEASSLAKNQQVGVSTSLRESELFQKHLDQAKRFTQEADYLESHSKSINVNLNDEFVEWLSSEPSKGSHHEPMGRAAAMAILADPSRAEPFAQAFIREKEGALHLPVGRENLQKEFESPLDSSLPIEVKAVDSFAEKATSNISRTLAQSAEYMETEIDRGLEQTSEQFKKAEKTAMNQDKETLENEFKARQQKNGVKEVLEGAKEAVLGSDTERTYQCCLRTCAF